MIVKAKEQLHDRICYVILKAPDRFPPDTNMTLEKAFEEMNQNLKVVFEDESAEYLKIASYLNEAYKNYMDLNQKQAIRNLQSIEDYLSGRANEIPSHS